jgi:RNA polymerase sigma factor for flagellar operon FliA
MQLSIQKYKKVADRQFRDRLVVEHLEYVRHVLGRIAAHFPQHVDRENLESAGVLGLVEAAGKFDQARGVDFRRYAYPRIRGAILDELRRNCPIPQHMLERITRLKHVREKLEPPVTPELLAKETGLSLEEVEDSLQAMRLSRFELWDDFTVGQHAVKSTADGAAARIEQSEAIEHLADAIEALPERERTVITLYYMEDLRLKEIGDVLHLSESRVSRILTKAKYRAKEYMRAKGLG